MKLRALAHAPLVSSRCCLVSPPPVVQAHSTRFAGRGGHRTPVCQGASRKVCPLKLSSVLSDVIALQYSGGPAGVRDLAPGARRYTLAPPLTQPLRPPARDLPSFRTCLSYRIFYRSIPSVHRTRSSSRALLACFFTYIASAC